MRILLFRPEADAERSARAIVAHGHEPILAPLFTIVRAAEPPPDGAFDAIVLTSGNAVESLAAGPPAWRDAPVFTVGARTARKVREAGFPDTRNADGDRRDLIALIRGNLSAPARLLLVVGRDHHEDAAETLAADGYAVTTWVAYAAEAVGLLPKTAAKAIVDGEADAALHYSARGAETFLTLARAVHLADEALALTHVALSAEVAAPLIAAGAQTVLVAEHPEELALLAALTQVSARRRANGGAMESPETGRGEETEPAMAQAPDERKRASRSKRTPPTIEGAAVEASSAAPEVAAAPESAPAAVEAAAEAILPTEALPREFDPPEPPPAETTAARAADPAPSEPPPPVAAPAPAPERQRSLLPALALASLVGGVVGAGLVMLALQLSTPPASVAQVAELRGRLDALQTANAGLDAKLSAATAAANAAATEAKAAVANAQKAGAEAQKAGVDAQAALSRAPAPDAQALAGLSAQAQRAEAAATAVGQRLDQTATRIGSVETLAKTAAAPSPQSLAAARIVLAERVQGALASGQPFAADVAALAKGGGAAEQLAALSAVAAAGAPTHAALLAQAKDHRVMFERELTPADAGWRERLVGLAGRIVTIRPVGDTGANDPGTLPARLETAIGGGRIGAAAELWGQLPEPARRASAAFGDALAKRAAADAAIAKIAQDAVAALGAAG